MRASSRELPLATEEITAYRAVIESLSYGVSVYSDDFRLILANKKYADTYRLPFAAMRFGVTTLRDICALTIEAGNHFGTTPDELHDTYRRRLLDQTDEAEPLRIEKTIQDRTIRTSHYRRQGLGWVLTHEDISDDADRLTALGRREEALARQAVRFETAVQNMAHGLAMFGPDHRLVICNRNYAAMYKLPDALTVPGTLFSDILDFQLMSGLMPIEGVEQYIDRRAMLVTDQLAAQDTVEFENGQIISIIHQPMNDRGWVETHQDITEQRRNEARIRHLARHDTLTNLPNRAVFHEEMEKAEQRIARGEPMAVLCFDLDHFKAVNDTLGHGIGDQVLKIVAERLNKTKRAHEIVARLGGDEFALLAGPLTRPGDVAVLAERIIKNVAEPMEIDGHRVMIGTSIGISVAPTDGEHGDILMKNADLALYRAKSEGRGTYHFFEKGMDAVIQHRRRIETGIKLGLNRNEFKVVFQPLMDLESNQVCCFEALLRWESPDLGAVSPTEFIPIAEETGFIVPLGEWVLRRACDVAAKWPEHVRIAVNLSPVQFKNKRLLETVKEALAGSGLTPTRLELEITESVLLIDAEQTLEILHALRELGVKISMDDFGTGYSSLSYLRAFPFDKIKIDRSFINDVEARDGNLEIIKAVIGLGRSLGMATTAEGVETEAQLDAVRAHGCTEVQGFFFSPPLAESSATELMARLSPKTAIPKARKAG